ncbi:hypothetical protein [Sphingorhabdus sp. Alg231-15]|uniref:hypothetical protein n=1 Tax=Sphingorhabdus sp. Alg231-15 TaxID=1922222 RepID=UPI000D55A0F2
MIYKTKPSDILAGSTVIKVTVIEKPAKSYRVRVRVLEGPTELKQKKIWISPDNFSSCTAIGRDVGYLAIKKSVSLQTQETYWGEVFERSWIDWIFDLLGADPYYLSSSRAVPFDEMIPAE